MFSRRSFVTRALGFSFATAAAVAIPSVALYSRATASTKKARTKTQANLMEAFAGESQANRKYLAFAQQAEKEGYTQVAKLFRAAAEAETIHAITHFRNAGKVGNTMENLKTAVEGELYEAKQMYPEMRKEATTEGQKIEEEYFAWAAAAEQGHADMYQKALDAKGNIAEVDYYLCSLCGYTHEGPHDGDCPVCGAGADVFYKFA